MKDELILYKSEDGTIKVDVHIQDETVWLTQAQMSDLFGKGRSTISEHIKNVFEEGELKAEVVCRDFRHTTQHGAIEGKTQTKTTRYYNLDVIISVGYRVKSRQGTQFRIWATQRLREYIIKGYTPSDAMTQAFFKEVQNKLLWAVSEKTAAELVYYRANAELPLMGLSSTAKEGKVTKTDVSIGKNYLQEQELASLKVIVEQYLAYAEAQAIAHRPMYMRDWIEKLGLILTMNERNILTHKGKVSHALAQEKAEKEYNIYQEKLQLEAKTQSIKELNDDLKRLK